MPNDKLSTTVLSPEQKRGFRDQLRDARGAALKDAEAFTEILFVIERLGAALHKKVEDLSTYKSDFKTLLGDDTKSSEEKRPYHTPFSNLYDTVRETRNDALHQGAKARHITTHAIRLSIRIEDALVKDMAQVSDYMVRNPVVASEWHPVSYVRQMMLENSFSFIPYYDNNQKKWFLLSDVKVASYLQSNRKERLTHCIKDVINDIKHDKSTKYCKSEDIVSDLISQKKLSFEPCLIFHPKDHSHLLGLITAFDIL